MGAIKGDTRRLDNSSYSPPKVDRIWVWVYSNKIPIYPIFYLLNGDYACCSSTVPE